ncbi:hypothetical protein [Achromobacter xylosoxidans]|uniref:Uncharacterized protein n=1 Tax=Achromobacter phage JWX TaxID=1589746 RepID=A0A0B5A1L5_9CAUD|nr:hypothetical protein [Achromobacter xylosoxidans]YP_009196197.1 hypothetical protein AVV28_gp12 [Achromobacter phage JWX]AJD82778.1 hypothetical protein JWX_00012 [Achromobacter phage JWX]WLW38433.1 hypothetical protein JWT_00009 [Achromobacter phage JWT]WNO48455.1 hypothetical protein [Achromobacter phage SE2]
MPDMIWPGTNPENLDLLKKQDAVDTANGNYPGGPVFSGGALSFDKIKGVAAPDQLPKATATTEGIVKPGTGLEVVTPGTIQAASGG